MKQILTLLVLSVVTIVLISCKTKSASQNTSSGDKTAAGASTCAAKVNFGSYGGGIDGVKYEAIKKLIEAKKLKFEEKRMGREGETELCLPLTELKKTEKAAFIEQLKKTAEGGQLVSVSTN
jgi:hypothetical protein